MREKEIGPREAAQRLGIRLDALYQLLWAGKIGARKEQGRWRVPVAAIEERAQRNAQRAHA
jgi:excisionase family DNA binding protein